MTVDEFIEKSESIHSYKYDYSKVKLTNCRDVVEVICPYHGIFNIVAGNHYRKDKPLGCPKCAKEAKAVKQLKQSKQLFIEKSKKIHGTKYVYDLSNFTVISKSSITITCPEHGEFTQSCSTHLSGSGCPECGKIINSEARSSNTADFIKKAKKVHNGAYSYYKTNYTTCREKVVITCPTHGDFEQRASAHIGGHGCPMCQSTGFNVTKPAILYYLSINNGEAFKIGITNRTVEERFSVEDKKKIEVLFTWSFTSGQEALDKEQELLKAYSYAKYTGPDLLASGNTELFKENVLKYANSDEPDAWRSSREYRVWRAKVIRRDKKCVICGGLNRQAHHINDGSNHAELRFEESNGVCLCNLCHTQFHTNFKNSFREKCTEKDWNNFLALWSYFKEVLC